MNDHPTTGGLEFADTPYNVDGAPPQPAPPPAPAAVTVENPPPPSFDKAPTDEEMAAGMVGLPTAAEASPRHDAKPRKTVRFVEAEREQKVPLAHPVECDGFVYDSIVVRRMNVSDFFDHFAKPDGERGRFPCFFDARGEPVPDEVLDALSLDDSAEVNEAYQRFLPASFRAEPAPSSTPSNGGASPPS